MNIGNVICVMNKFKFTSGKMREIWCLVPEEIEFRV